MEQLQGKAMAKPLLVSSLALVAALCVVTAALPYAGAASDPNHAERPAPRYWTRAVYDSKADRMILFGGGNVSAFNDTWAYDMNSNTWTQMHPPTSPPARMGHMMAYDVQSDRVVLFGGIPLIAPCADQFRALILGDTWVYDYANDTWTQLFPHLAPYERYVAGMTYDSGSDRVIMFGGQEYQLAVKNDTWAFDLDTTTWTHMHPDPSPIGYPAEEMAYDPAADLAYISGGWTPWNDDPNETWAYDYDADRWTQVAFVDPPPSRMLHHLAFDTRQGRLVLFGGEGEASLSDVWVLENSSANWSQVIPAGSGPPDVAGGAFAYDSESGSFFLFGGARVSQINGGCSAGDLRAVIDDQWAFDAAGNRWTSLTRPEAPAKFAVVLRPPALGEQATSVGLEWEAVPAPNGTTIGSAVVYRNGSGGALERFAVIASGTNFVDNNVSCGATYGYAVAYESSAGEGRQTPAHTVRTAECPVAPEVQVTVFQVGLLALVLVGAAAVVFAHQRSVRRRPPDE